MSKFNTTLTYNKKNLYNIFYDIELNKSIRVQFTDLRLRDFTDVTGELKFWYFMPQEKFVKLPHLYKVYNDEKSFLVLGTNHGLPLSAYSQKIIDTIFDSKVLIVENLGYDEVTNDSMSASEDNESEVDNKDYRVLEDHSQDDIFKETWFEKMPVLCQQYLEAFFDKIVAPILESRNLVLKVSNFDEESIYDILTSLPSEKGMDATIQKKFEADGKKLDQLETANEREIEYEELRENPFEVLKEFLEFCKGSGIFALEPLIEASKNYLDGKTREDKIDDTIGIRNAIWLNKFPKFLQENPEGILVKVGGLHLFTETGFVTHFYKEGWTIERADIDANFYPIELSGDFYPVDLAL